MTEESSEEKEKKMISWHPKPDFLKFFSNSTDSDKPPLSSSVIENGVLSPQELDPSSPPVSSPLPSDSSEPNNPSPQLPLNVPPPQAASPPPSNSNSLPPSSPSNVSPLPVSPPSPPLSNSPPTGIAQPSFPPAKPSPSSGNSLPLSPPVISMPAPAAVETPPSSPVDGSSRQTVTPPLQNAPSGATPSPLPLSSSPPNVVPPSNDPNPIPPTAMTTPSTPQSTTPSSQQSNSFPSLTSPSTQSGASPSSQQVLPRSSWNSSKAIPEILIGISVATVVLIIGLVAFVFFRLGKETKKRRTNDLPGKPVSSGIGNGYGSDRGNVSDHSDAIGNSKQWFTYKELLEITDGFSWQTLLGEGGFGCVYKGLLPDGREVAVKQLKAGNGQGEREFRAEAEIISRVHHRHLVSVVGYCIDENQGLLVYEYVPNKTLEHHLHGKGVPVMDWAKRVKIAIGAAKGLAYLHEDCHPRIIHRDIKSANILLDNSFEAKVADFGLAKPSNDSKSHVSTRVMGTFGYMAPEYASSGKLTDRSDVFSFGVVLLELVTGLRPVDTSRPLGEESLVEWARPLLVRALDGGDLGELVDSRLENNNDSSEMLNMIEVAAACVRHSAWRRPRMVQVVRALGYERDMPDITNGVKVGQSIEYDSSQYSADIREFQKRPFSSADYSPDHGYSGDTDQKNSTYSEEYQSREAQSWQGSALNSNGVCEQLRV